MPVQGGSIPRQVREGEAASSPGVVAAIPKLLKPGPASGCAVVDDCAPSDTVRSTGATLRRSSAAVRSGQAAHSAHAFCQALAGKRSRDSPPAGARASKQRRRDRGPPDREPMRPFPRPASFSPCKPAVAPAPFGPGWQPRRSAATPRTRCRLTGSVRSAAARRSHAGRARCRGRGRRAARRGTRCPARRRGAGRASPCRGGPAARGSTPG